MRSGNAERAGGRAQGVRGAALTLVGGGIVPKGNGPATPLAAVEVHHVPAALDPRRLPGVPWAVLRLAVQPAGGEQLGLAHALQERVLRDGLLQLLQHHRRALRGRKRLLWLVRHENIPTRPMFDWFIMRIHPRVLCSIGSF
eukprot:1191671-Prorocentrum_minimum.AAC.1